MASVDFWNSVGFNASVTDFDAPDDEDPPHIEGCANGLVGSARSVLSSYIVPPETWLLLTPSERRRNWVTPRIPPTVSLDCWTALSVPRIAYVREDNWQRTGARGLFSISHHGQANFGVQFVIGRPISPSLYNYANKTLGESGANFAILARNTHWISAAIGGFDEADDDFLVHYNDDGPHYRLLKLPFHVVTDYIKGFVPKEVREASWGADPVAAKFGGVLPLTTAVGVAGAVPANPAPLTAADAPGTTVNAPLINEGFYGVKLERFWPQFMTALELALSSPIASRELLNTLRQKQHWLALNTYMEQHRGGYSWVAPLYAVGSVLGRSHRPDYLS